MSITQEEFDFEAEPRVVKSRSKYKINDQQSVSKSQQTFNTLMMEKRIRMQDPVSQEQEYVKREKERIKVDNMHSQLNNFKRNKKRMTPYEIKPSANPRIQVNLEFFLTDSANTIEKTASTVDTQTDTFAEPPPSPKYVPKKTGIDAATQVEDYELFNFDQEVSPILDVIVSKSLEEVAKCHLQQACLEIEEEQEILSMRRYKEAFIKRKVQERDTQRQVVQQENDQITKKNEILKKYMEREEKKVHFPAQQIKNYILQKAQAYEIAGRFLRDLRVNTFVQVVEAGFYPDTFANQLHTTFLDKLILRTQQEAVKVHDVRQKLNGTFDPDALPPMQGARMANDAIVQKKRQHNSRRRTNAGTEERVVRVVYWDDKQLPSTIAQKFSKFVDGSLEEWEKVYEARMQELDAKLDSDQMAEEEYLQLKRAEFPDTIPNYLGISVHSIRKFGFAVAHNQFYETTEKERRLQPFALVIEKSGKWLVIDAQNPRDGKTLRYKDNYRVKHAKVSDDVAIILQLESLNIDVCCVLFGVRLPNLQQNSQQQAIQDYLQHSRVSVYDSYHYIPFDPTSVVQSFKFEEYVRTIDNPEQADLPQTSIAFCYALTKRFKQFGKWYLESLKVATKGLLPDEIPGFHQRVATFVAEQYESTLQLDKELVERMLDKEKEGDGAGLSANEQNSIISKRRLPQSKSNVSALNQTINSNKEASMVEHQKNLDEPQVQLLQLCQDVPKSLSYSRVMHPLRVRLELPFEESESALIKHLTEHEAPLVDSCVFGFEVHCRGKPFIRQRQLIRVRSIGEMTLVRKPEPIPEKVEPTDQPLQDDGDPPNDD